MELEFSGEIWHWKGPSPFHFVTVPEDLCDALDALAGLVSYGWGMIPVSAGIGDTEWKTALWPKDGRYIVPLKADVRRAEDLEVGATTTVRLFVDAYVSTRGRVSRRFGGAAATLAARWRSSLRCGSSASPSWAGPYRCIPSHLMR